MVVIVPVPGVPEQPGGGGAAFAAPALSTAVARNGQAASGRQVQRLGLAMQGAGIQVAQQASLLQEQRHVSAAQRAQALAEEKILAADLDYMNRVGTAATGEQREQAWEALQREVASIESGLGHGREKRMFRQALQQRMLGTGARWMNHEIAQTRVEEIGAATAVAESHKQIAINSLPGDDPAVLDDGDPGTAKNNLDAFRAKLEQLGQLQGIAGPELEQFIRKEVSDVHDGRIRSLVRQGRATEASDLLAEVGADLDARQRDSLQGLTQRASRNNEAVDLVTRIQDELEDEFLLRPQPGTPDDATLEGISIEGSVPVPPLPAAELLVDGNRRILALADAGRITPEVRDAAFAELSMRASQRNDELAQAALQVRARYQSWLIDNAPAGVAALSVRDPQLFQLMQDHGLTAEAVGFAGGKGRTSDPGVWQRAERISDADLANMTEPEFERAFAGALTPQHLSEVAARWRTAQGRATAEDESTLSKVNRRKLSFIEAGLWPSRRQATEEEVLDRGRIEREIQRRVVDEERAGRPTDGEAYQAIIDKVLIDTATALGETQPVGALTPREFVRATRVSTGLLLIGAEERREIVANLEAEGLEITEANLVDEFRERERDRRRRGVR